MKGYLTHVTIDIAYSIPIFYRHLNWCFFCTRKPFADSSQYLHSTYSVLPLRTYIEDALYPYIALQDCLVVDMERIEDTPIIYNTITQKVYENGQWSKQDLDLHGKLLIYVKSSPPMPAATEQINNGF